RLVSGAAKAACRSNTSRQTAAPRSAETLLLSLHCRATHILETTRQLRTATTAFTEVVLQVGRFQAEMALAGIHQQGIVGEWRCETSLPEQYIPPDCSAPIR